MCVFVCLSLCVSVCVCVSLCLYPDCRAPQRSTEPVQRLLVVLFLDNSMLFIDKSDGCVQVSEISRKVGEIGAVNFHQVLPGWRISNFQNNRKYYCFSSNGELQSRQTTNIYTVLLGGSNGMGLGAVALQFTDFIRTL